MIQIFFSFPKILKIYITQTLLPKIYDFSFHMADNKMHIEQWIMFFISCTTLYYFNQEFFQLQSRSSEQCCFDSSVSTCSLLALSLMTWHFLMLPWHSWCHCGPYASALVPACPLLFRHFYCCFKTEQDFMRIWCWTSRCPFHFTSPSPPVDG